MKRLIDVGTPTGDVLYFACNRGNTTGWLSLDKDKLAKEHDVSRPIDGYIMPLYRMSMPIVLPKTLYSEGGMPAGLHHLDEKLHSNQKVEDWLYFNPVYGDGSLWAQLISPAAIEKLREFGAMYQGNGLDKEVCSMHKGLYLLDTPDMIEFSIF